MWWSWPALGGRATGEEIIVNILNTDHNRFGFKKFGKGVTKTDRYTHTHTPTRGHTRTHTHTHTHTLTHSHTDTHTLTTRWSQKPKINFHNFVYIRFSKHCRHQYFQDMNISVYYFRISTASTHRLYFHQQNIPYGQNFNYFLLVLKFPHFSKCITTQNFHFY
jgi:hypothetical protein